MTITVLLMSILTGQNHTIVAEYDTPQACEAAAQAHQKVLLGNDIRAVYSCSLKRAHANERSYRYLLPPPTRRAPARRRRFNHGALLPSTEKSRPTIAIVHRCLCGQPE